MSSKIEICNLALARIGQGIINNLDEFSPQAEQCRLHYASTRDALLREFPWNFSTRNILLAAAADKEVPGWLYIYQHPLKVLWVRKLFTVDDTEPEIPHQYEIVSTDSEKLICCDLYQAYAKCTMSVENEELFDPSFVEAFSYKLALALAMPLTNSSSRTQEVFSMYQQAIVSAKLAGAVEGGPKKHTNQQARSAKSYITARR